ncbi:hypothetical protein AB0D83_35130 [Streptomyces decoyicus]|uniref:hypothetical protein n=1 Tax=Streptomyces decoyicus TaxID=249567 RepID=UPI0033E0D6EC
MPQLRLRLQDNRTHRLRSVAFRFVGVVKEFPTAPKDSFLVANASYVARSTGSGAVGTLLVDTGGSGQRAVAHQARSVLGPTAQVTDLSSARTVTESSLTAVDLGGLTRVELGFALVIGAAAGGLVLALGLTERRRTLALASVLGARRRQLSGFVWSEAGGQSSDAAYPPSGRRTRAQARMPSRLRAQEAEPSPPSAVPAPWVQRRRIQQTHAVLRLS